MSNPDRSSFLHVSWPQAAVATVLTVILVAVMIMQLAGGSRAAAARTDSARADKEHPQGKRPREAAANQQDTGTSDAWQSTSLDRVLSYDPFKPRAAFPIDEQQTAAAGTTPTAKEKTDAARAERIEQARAARQQALARLSDRRVNAFLAGGPAGDVALIGDQRVRVGDVLDGFRVVAIDADGVVVEPVESLAPAVRMGQR